MNETGKRLMLWLPPVLWAAAIFTVSSFPSSRLPGRIPSELGHLGEYFVLGALIYLALRIDLPPGRALAAAVVLASVFGMTDEFHQAFVPTRTPDPADWATDTLGAFLGASVAWWVAARFSAWRKPTQSPTGDSQ